eukprot:augustus_masked-scaffold_17-processed-gene-0.6-mRNA-1 protein AED:1.00 eAED:1.00 QI:0/0/0/0/1/1/2/0/245
MSEEFYELDEKGNPRPRVPRPRSARGLEIPESTAGRGHVGSDPESPSRVVEEVPPQVGPKPDAEDPRGGRVSDPGSPLGSITADEFLTSMMNQFRRLNMATSIHASLGREAVGSRGGFRPPKIQKHDALDRDKLGEFVLRMEKMRKCARVAGADISVTDWMSIHILELAEAQEVNISDDEAIMNYLKLHLEGAQEEEISEQETLSSRNAQVRVAELNRKIEELEKKNRRTEQPQRPLRGNGKKRM